MKSLETILKKRQELKKKEREVIEAKLSMNRFDRLDDDEKREYMRLSGIIIKLNLQIDALTYVINYDSELNNVVIGETFKHKSVDRRF